MPSRACEASRTALLGTVLWLRSCRCSIAPVYVSSPVTAPDEVFYRALWTNHAVHAAGIGMRALSVVDIAAWDLAAKAAGQPIADLLGGELRPMPATAIVGYPPTISAEETAEQVGSLWEAGWRRFKVPISPTLDHSVERLEAVRAAAPDGWVGFDLNMVLHSAAEVLDFEKRVRHLAWAGSKTSCLPGTRRWWQRCVRVLRLRWRWAMSKAVRTIRRHFWPWTPWTCYGWMPLPTAG